DQMAGAARQILPFGIPTLLEKPPGTSLAEFESLVQLAEQHSTATMVALNRRHYSVLKNAIADAGGPQSITAAFLGWSGESAYLLDQRGYSPRQVSRHVFNNSLHGLDLLTYLAGELEAPRVIGHSLGEPFRWLMGLQGVSRRGVLATFESTWDSPGPWR